MAMPDFATVEEYLASVPEVQRAGLETLRARLRTVLPRATERMWYKMPTFVMEKPVLAYAAGVWLSVVYLADHYVVDIVGGVVYALAAAWLVTRPGLVRRLGDVPA